MSDVVPDSSLSRVRVVMVNTSNAGNIGGTARAMKNMGLSNLHLVSPRNYPAPEAQWRAVSAEDVLQSATITSCVEQSIKGCALVIGASARERRIPWPLLTPRECAALVVEECQQHPVAILFGREDRGLSNEELRLCQYHVHIPTNDEYSSLNVAMAVQVIAYEVWQAVLNKHEVPSLSRVWDIDAAPVEDMEQLFEHMERALRLIGFIAPKAPRQTMTRLRRLFNRQRLDQMEVGMLRGVMSAVEKAARGRGNKG